MSRKPATTVTTGTNDPLPPVASLLGSHGRLRVCTETGSPVVAREHRPEAYQDVERVDWAEYRAWLATLPAGLVLELCLDDFTVHLASGVVEPADPDSRAITAGV